MPPDPAALRQLCRRDPALRPLLRRHGPYPAFPLPRHRRRGHFESLVRAILAQQLAAGAAAAITRRVAALEPGRRFPAPEAFLRAGPEGLRLLGVSGNKAKALLDLAGRVASGRLRLEGLGRLPDEEIVARLVEVRGIGVWTAQMFLLFRLGRLDVLPVADLGVREGMRRLDGLADRPRPSEAEARGARWAPLRSVGSWLMWRLCDAAEPGLPGA